MGTIALMSGMFNHVLEVLRIFLYLGFSRKSGTAVYVFVLYNCPEDPGGNTEIESIVFEL